MAWANLGVAAVGAWASVESSKNKAKAGAAGLMPTIGMDTEAKSVNAIFDNSGWNVAFGGSDIDSTAEKSLAQSGPAVPNSPSLGATTIGGQPAPAGYAGGFAGIDNQTLLYGGLVLFAVMAWKKKSSS